MSRNRLISYAVKFARAGCIRGSVVASRPTSSFAPALSSNGAILHTKLNLSHARRFSTNPDWSDDTFNQVLKEDSLVVFMKGTPDAPQCGFSKYVIQILTMHGCESFKTFNVLEDDTLRNRVKEFSSWPTIPQIYMNGEFVGGFDILLQMHQNGELIEEFEKIGHRSILIDADEEN